MITEQLALHNRIKMVEMSGSLAVQNLTQWLENYLEANSDNHGNYKHFAIILDSRYLHLIFRLH